MSHQEIIIFTRRRYFLVVLCIVIYSFGYGFVSDLTKKYSLKILFSLQIRLLDFKNKMHLLSYTFKQL